MTYSKRLTILRTVALTYRHFYAAIKKQGIDRRTLPYRGKLQPYASYVAMFGCGLMMLLLGYDLFIAGGWDITHFFLDYTFLAAFTIAVVFWKFVKRTRYIRPGQADLKVNGLVQEIDEYEQLLAPSPSSGISAIFERFLRMARLKR